MTTRLPIISFTVHIDSIYSLFQGFFNSLRPELANYPGIVISMVCPGLVHSNIVKNAFAEEMNKVQQVKHVTITVTGA